MNKRIESILLLSLVIISILIAISPLMVVEATITGRPKIYVDNTYADPQTVRAGASVNIYLGEMTISGAQIWLWLSKTGGATIEPNDAYFVGPFYINDVYANESTTYTFTPDKLPTPFNKEGRTYTYTVGYGWINGTLPLLVEGVVYYWLKITDVTPTLGTGIPSSDVAVSTNRIVFTETCTASLPDPPDVAPLTPVTITCGAVATDKNYNITQVVADTTVEVITVTPTVTSVTTPYGTTWTYTSLTKDIKIVDLARRYPESGYDVSVKVVRLENTGVTVAEFTYTVPAREVYFGGEDVTYELREHNYDYSGTVKLYTGRKYNITVNWFPYNGSINIYLNNTLLVENVALNKTGGVLNVTIVIPLDIASGTYVIRVIDNNNVEYNFTVYILVIPGIKVYPKEGYVFDVITVEGWNFQDYVGQYITILFETCNMTGRFDKELDVTIDTTSYHGFFKIVANFTVPSSKWTYNITVPITPGGDHYIIVGDKDGVPLSPKTPYDTFTVKPKLMITPEIIPANYNGIIKVLGLGYTADVGFWVTVDNAFVGVAFCDVCGYFEAKLPSGGFRPGLHVVGTYGFTDTLGNLVDLKAYVHFFVTDEGDIIAGKLDELNAIIMGIRDDVVYIKTETGVIEAKLDTVISLIKDAVITEIENGFAKVLTEIGQVRVDLATLTRLIQGVDAKLTSIAGDVAYIKTNVTTIAAKLTALEPVIISIRDTVVYINTTLGLIEAKLDAIKPEITSIKDNIVTINTTLGTITGEITSIEGDIATIKADIGTIKTSLSNVLTGISDIKSTLATISSDVKDAKSAANAAKTAAEDAKSTADKARAAAEDAKSGIADVKTLVEDVKDTVTKLQKDATVIPAPISIGVWLAALFSLIALILSAVAAASVRRKIAG